MIIFGTKGAHVRTEPLPGATCPTCTAPETLQLSVFSRYAHIYWIPLFPFSKPTLAQCTQCLSTWEQQHMPLEVRGAAQQLKEGVAAPIWHWAGLAIIGLFVAWSAVVGAL